MARTKNVAKVRYALIEGDTLGHRMNEYLSRGNVGRNGMRSLTLTLQDISACFHSRHSCVCVHAISLIGFQSIFPRPIQPLYNRRGTAIVSNTTCMVQRVNPPISDFRFPRARSLTLSNHISDIHPQTKF